MRSADSTGGMHRTAPDIQLARPDVAPPPSGLGGLMVVGAGPAGSVAPAAASKRRCVTSLTVAIPARNEEANIGPLLVELGRVLAPLQADGLDVEIVVVDDGSTDGTPTIAAAHGATVVTHADSLGNGAAVKRGIRTAARDWVLLLDGDGQHPPADIPAMLALAERYDMVVGSREGRGGAWHRNVANKIYNGLASYVTGRRIPDLTSGFRLVRADALKSFVYLLPNTFSYPTTITLAMLRAGYSVAFHPIAVRPRRGKSHIRLLADGSRFLMIILRIATFFAPLRVFGPVAALVFAAGVGWYAFTYFAYGRFTNMAVMLMVQATMIFGLGLVSEQIAALRQDRASERNDRR